MMSRAAQTHLAGRVFETPALCQHLSTGLGRFSTGRGTPNG